MCFEQTFDKNFIQKLKKNENQKKLKKFRLFNVMAGMHLMH